MGKGGQGRFFRVERDAPEIAVVVFDARDEAVNTLSDDVLGELEELLADLEADSAVKAAVLASGKPDTFIAGAKLEMIQGLATASDAEALSRRAQARLERLERSRLPVVAAIHGACLGGGLEVALACAVRVASDDSKTSLGLPEVSLGLLPAAGGTQRLPRLVGWATAVDLVLSGRQLKASKALKLGLVDEVVPAPLLRKRAVARAAAAARGELPAREGVGLGRLQGGKAPRAMLDRLLGKTLWTEAAMEGNPIGRTLLFRKVRERTLAKTRGHYPAPLKALEAIQTGAEGGPAKGYAAEARLFGELVVSQPSRRLVELFFAQTSLKKESGVPEPGTRARPVKKIGIVGGGLMGSGVAYVSIHAGLECRLRDRDHAAVGRALSSVRGILEERARRRSISALERDATLARLTGTTDYSGFARADLVVEAVFEDLALKHKVLAEFEAVGKPDAVFASNTSSIPIGRIAQPAKRPENVVGMHYFSPVQKMPLLEVIRAKGSSPEAVATAVAVGKRQGRTVIVVRDGAGFYTSRILAPYLNEAARLIVEGAAIEEIDVALVELGFPVGPMTLLDEVGVDVAAKVSHVMHEAFGDRMAAPAGFEALVRDGRLGRKATKGFFRYDLKTGKKLKEADEAVYKLVRGGEARRSIDRGELGERVLLQMVNEAVRCLGEGILQNPRDGDVGAVLGLGFPPFLGGPFRYVDREGAGPVLERLRRYQDRCGARFLPAPLLEEMAKAGRRFHAG